MTPLLWSFTAISLLLAVTPGPDMAVVTRDALAHRARGVLLTTSGIACALLLWVAATAAGVSALLQGSGQLLTLLRLIGGIYLAYLGLRSWWESRRPPAALPLASTPLAATPIFRQGFLSAATNPKLGVFFVTFLPQFVDRQAPVAPQLLLLGGIFATVGWVWMNIYGLAITRLQQIITAPRVRQWMERLTGTVLIGLGLRLALERG